MATSTVSITVKPPAKPVERSVIDEIADVYAERGDSYGRPLGPFTGVTKAAEALGISPSGGALHHALYMVLLKISRLIESPNHRDSLMDIVGYVKTYEQCLEDMPQNGKGKK